MPKQTPKPGGRSGKSSKTARVLNLLTDPDLIESPAESGAPQAAADSAKLVDDRKTQASIRGALEGALEMELSETAAPARPKRSKSASASASGKAAQDSDPKPAQEDSGAAEAETPAGAAERPTDPVPFFPVTELMNTPLESTISDLRAASEKMPDEYICFNVMQALVEDRADKYIKMFGLCDCSRCRIDVVALALSNLPAKYVVAQPNELIPRLSIYEQRFSAAVVTQVMSACRKVLDRPHHQREQST